jgi:ech hydrogenase subunit D
MSDEQTYLSLSTDALLARVRELREQGWRLVQIGATPLGETIELNYSFDRAGKFLNLRLSLPAAGAHVPSISSIYWCAFIYENEMHDLFRVRVDGIAVDYKGKFYKTAVPYPFSSRGPTAGVTPSGAVVAAAPPATPVPVGGHRPPLQKTAEPVPVAAAPAAQTAPVGGHRPPLQKTAEPTPAAQTAPLQKTADPAPVVAVGDRRSEPPAPSTAPSAPSA